jgi:ribose transport system substrate-binding protein
MFTAQTQTRLRRLSLVASVAVLAISLSGCATAAGNKPATSAAADDSLGACGTLSTTTPADADGVLAALPADAQKGYQAFPYAVAKSAWADSKALTTPFKLGFVTLPGSAGFGNDVGDELVKRTKAGKADGTTDGNLVVSAMTSYNPSEQIQLFQQTVASGVNAILIFPLSGPAMVDAVNAAGAKGIPTIAVNNYIPSKYAINVLVNPYLNAMIPISNAIKIAKGKGDMLMVNGIQGDTNTSIASAGLTEMLKGCPNLNLAGQVDGGYSVGGAKAAVQKFLASHPGPISVAGQTGVMGAGVVAAFQQTGRPVPVVSFSGLQAAESGYWAANVKKGYSTSGSMTNGVKIADVVYDVAIKTLQGQGPKIDSFAFYPTIVTDKTVAATAPAGADINAAGESVYPGTFVSDTLLNEFFTTPSK